MSQQLDEERETRKSEKIRLRILRQQQRRCETSDKGIRKYKNLLESINSIQAATTTQETPAKKDKDVMGKENRVLRQGL